MRALLILLALILPGIALGQTTVNVEVDTDGTADYSSLEGFDSDLGAGAGVTSGDLVTNTEIVQVECRASTGSADTGGWNVSASWTTSDTYYIRAFAPSDAHHSGTYPTGNIYRLEKSTTDVVTWTDQCIVLDGLPIKQTGSTQWRYGIDCTGGAGGDGRVEIVNCIVTSDSLAANQRGVAINRDNDHILVNNVVSRFAEGFLTTGIADTTDRVIFFNNTVVNINNLGYNPDYQAACKAYNNVGTNCGGGAFAAASNFNQAGDDTDYSVSDDATASVGSNSVTGSTPDYNDPGNYDFTITADDSTTVCRDNGHDLEGNAHYDFNTDAIGTTRPQNVTWDRGFHELIQATGRRRTNVSG